MTGVCRQVTIDCDSLERHHLLALFLNIGYGAPRQITHLKLFDHFFSSYDGQTYYQSPTQASTRHVFVAMSRPNAVAGQQGPPAPPKHKADNLNEQLGLMVSSHTGNRASHLSRFC